MIIKSIRSYNWTGMTVLIVDDDPTGTFFLSEILQHTGIKIISANNGINAVEICKKNPEIDIILMDMQLPGISGYEATHLIKTERECLPIVAQTAFALVEDRDKCEKAGCDAYISKPINTFELLAIMEMFLNKSSVKKSRI